MMECWNIDPDQRPPFSEIMTKMDLYLETMSGYLVMSGREEPGILSELPDIATSDTSCLQ